MSDLDKMIPQNLLMRLQTLEREVNEIKQQLIIYELSQITPNLGNVTSGEMQFSDEVGTRMLITSRPERSQMFGVDAWLVSGSTSTGPEFWIDKSGEPRTFWGTLRHEVGTYMTVSDSFCGGGTTSGTIGELGWQLPAGTVSSANNTGLILNSTATNGTFGRLLLAPAGNYTMKVVRAVWRVKIPAFVSAGGNVAVGIWTVQPGSGTPAATDGIVVYTTAVSGSYWQANSLSLAGGGTLTNIAPTTLDPTTIDIDLRWTPTLRFQNPQTSLEFALQGTPDFPNSGGYIMARAYRNTTSRQLALLGFSAILVM